jgi:hypothetical protein
MLRVSAMQTERDIDLDLINGDVSETPGLKFAAELTAFAEAVASMDEAALTAARSALADSAGAAVLVDAAGVAGNFQRMVRIADSMGIPVDDTENEMQNEIREKLDLYRFRSSENSRRTT